MVNLLFGAVRVFSPFLIALTGRSILCYPLLSFSGEPFEEVESLELVVEVRKVLTFRASIRRITGRILEVLFR